MNLVRKYKISKLTNKPLKGIEHEIIEFVHSWLKDLIPFKWKKYPLDIYYMNSAGLCVLELCDLEYYKKNNEVRVRWVDFWEVLSDKYNLDYEDIQILLKFMVEESFKQEVRTLEYLNSILKNDVEIAFKKYLTTIHTSAILPLAEVEKAFKENESYT